MTTQTLEELDPATNPAIAAIQASGLDHEIRTHGRASSLREAAEQRGVTPRQILKSMVVRHGDDYSIVLVPGDRVISWPKLRAALRVNRAVMPSAEEAKTVTGFARGTITPFGTATQLPVLADELVEHGPVTLGGGAHSVAFYVNGDELLAHFGASRIDITDADPSFE
ncbi:MAG: aminoacyl-tRNA deacylase [Gulosibacter sp.]|uniref:aminoacyl-tRNA deacylase n=1 Tax=Gulosibacter sp. TaxID=2817531 RepID=UPI003F8F7DE7